MRENILLIKILKVLKEASKPLNTKEITELSGEKYTAVATEFSRINKTKEFNKYIHCSKVGIFYSYEIREEYKNFDLIKMCDSIRKGKNKFLRGKKSKFNYRPKKAEVSEKEIEKVDENISKPTKEDLKILPTKILKSTDSIKNLKESIIKSVIKIVPETSTKIIIPFQTKKGSSIKIEVEGKVKIEELVKFLFEIIE